MELRAMTGYAAHAVLLGYGLWVIASTAPELRKGNRDRQIRVRILTIKTAGFVLTALIVGVIHYWATAWWQVLTALPIAAVLGVLLRRVYRRTVAAPRHRLTIARRAQTLDLRRRPRRGGPPLHQRLAATASPVVEFVPVEALPPESQSAESLSAESVSAETLRDEWPVDESLAGESLAGETLAGESLIGGPLLSGPAPGSPAVVPVAD